MITFIDKHQERKYLIKQKSKFTMLNKKCTGFTLAEAMLAILITVFCMQILYSTLYLIKHSDKNKEPINEVAYAYVQMNNFLKENKHTEIDLNRSNSQRIILKVLDEKSSIKEPVFKRYVITGYQDMIRMQGIAGGHVPLILNVTRVSFSYHKTNFKISFNEEKKGNSELIFQVDEPLKVKNDDSHKEKVNEKQKENKS
ncbi:competence protein ComGE [Lactobacillus sp. PV012]|nr:competence protein ComGE [Lactobacillus sp. PV012]